MSGALEFVHARGEYASFLVVLGALFLAAGPTSRLLGLRGREVGDLFFNGAIAFLVAGRLAYVVVEGPRTLLDPLVVIRFQAGIEPLAGVLGTAAVVAWHLRGRDSVTRWAILGAGAAGLAVATAGYDLACVARDACYGAAAPAPFGFEMSGLSEPRMATPLIEAALVFAVLAAVLGAARRITLGASSFLLAGALALIRAALTPASALGAEAIGLETIVLAVTGAAALAGAVTVQLRVPAPV